MNNLVETKKIRKRTISKTFKDSKELGGFCGWDKIESILGSLNASCLPVFVGMFSFGCRAGELRHIMKDQVHLDYSKDQVEIRNAYVSKWRNNNGSRTFHLNKSESVYPYLEEIVSSTPDGSPVFPFTYNQIYYRVAQVEAPEFKKPNGSTRTDWSKHKGSWWPHRIRAERACQLIRDYGFTTYALKRWFGWRTDQMPGFYGELTNEDVARMMLKPQQNLEVTPELLLTLDQGQRTFILELLEGK